MPARGAGCPHAGDSQPGPDRPPWEVADIFRLSGDTYRQTHAVSAAQHKVIARHHRLSHRPARGACRTVSAVRL